MKTKKVNQYQCDFCGKKNYSAGHMVKHELHCTSNPNRICGFCKIDGNKNNLEELKAMLPKPEYPLSNYFFGEPQVDYFDLKNKEEMITALEKLKEKANFCPACILAVLKQLKICCYAIGFDYKKEKNEFFEDRKPDVSECCY